MEQPEQDGTSKKARGNTKSRAYCLTINNWEDKDILDIKNLGCTYVIGKEYGTSGTPHLQCVIRFSNPRSFEFLKKKLPRAHIEKCKDYPASIIYCQKDGDFESNVVEIPSKKESLISVLNAAFEEEYGNIVWKTWQSGILELIEEKPNRRTVNWFHENIGNTGKSFVCKYLVWKHDAIIVNGKQNDIFCAVKNFIEEKKKYPKIIVCDIPRTNQAYVCYSSMEKLKDGCFMSGKYESGQILLPSLHLICFANFAPELDKLSQDRWNVVDISECEPEFEKTQITGGDLEEMGEHLRSPSPHK